MRNNIIIVLMLLGLTFLGTSVVLADLNNGLVAYYPFNGNANDESGNGNNGTVDGATLTTDRLGNTNSAYSFDGSSNKINASVGKELSVTYLTLSAWIRITGSGTYNPRIVAVGPTGSAYQHYSLILEGTTSQRRLWFYTSTNVTNAYSSSTLLDNDGNWHNTVVTYDGSQVKFYIDGVIDNTTVVSGSIKTFTSALLQVGYSDNGTDRFQGIIDDIRIYNRALSSSEIEELYNYGSTPASPTTTTKSATNVKSTSATLNGTVNANGGTTTAWFEYGNTSGTYSNTTSTQTISSGWSDTSVTADISGLSSKTTYYYRLVAQNSVGTTYGSETSFATTAPPTVTTGSGTNITMISATLNGTVNANGTSTTAWFEYGKTSGAYDKTTTTQGVSGSSDTSVGIYVSGLSSGTGYYYRLVAQNNAGVSYGSENSFTTITSSTPVPTLTPVSSDGDIVIYDTDIDGDWNIYKSDLGGINSIQLTNDLAEDLNPQISFNKTKIAFRSTRSSSRTDLWIMNIDGSNQVQLTSSGSDEDFYPRWSMDDTKLTFSAYRPYGTGGRIMLINADGTGEKELYYKSGYDSYAAGFINNNTKVIFLRQVRYCGGDATLMSIGIDGSNPTEIINISDLIGVDGGEVNRWGGPQVNQEENKVVFEYEYCDGKNFIYKIGVDGNGLQMLVDSTNDPISPNWTSDDRIVYSTINSMTNKFELWIMDSDGSNNKLLISNEKANFKFGSLIVTATQIPTPTPTPTPHPRRHRYPHR